MIADATATMTTAAAAALAATNTFVAFVVDRSDRTMNPFGTQTHLDIKKVDLE